MTLADLIADDDFLMALGVYDAITATLAQQAGARAVYMLGSCMVSSLTGGPDVGLMTMTEMTTRARRIAGAVDVPMIADAGTGYGNELNVRRTVSEYERAGVDAIQLEDQTFPKRCGHFEGKEVVVPAEFATKVAAATDARSSDEFLVVARTDALAVEWLESAIERARHYREAGTDVLFVEAPTEPEQMEWVTEEVPDPHLANMATKGKTPPLSADRLADIGYDLAIYPSDAFKPGLVTFQEVYETFLEERSQESILDRIGMEERDRVTGLGRVEALERRYERRRAEYWTDDG